MCLSVVYRGKEKKEALAKLPESFYVWKVVAELGGGGFETDCMWMRLHSGVVKFVTNIINRHDHDKKTRYRGGGHFWRTRAAAEYSQVTDENEKIVRCLAKKSDITSIGMQSFDEVIVLKKAVFPKWVGEAG